MTKKDFEFLAKLIRELYLSQKTKEYIANYFASILASKYPKFKKDKFIMECIQL